MRIWYAIVIATAVACSGRPVVHHETSLDWSQQSLRSPGEAACREQGRIPMFDPEHGFYVECLAVHK